MTFPRQILRTHRQLILLLLWVTFVGWSMWQHAQRSQQPPLYDASTYYVKAYNFWTKVHQHKLFNPLNVEPSFRPPGTILMSYPFGFESDYRGFYFRAIFLPIVLLCLAVVISGYRRELDSRSKWQLVLFAAFLSSLPCLYSFEISPIFPVITYWGLVDNFLAGVAALAAAAAVRSIWTRSVAWICLAAFFSSFCLLIKPTGILVMMLIGLAWLGLAALELKSVWQSFEERTSTTRWLLYGLLIFAVPYLSVLAISFTSHYLSSQNLALGNAAIVVMRRELPLSWSVILSTVTLSLGYPFLVWLFLMIILVGSYLWRRPADCLLWSGTLHAGLVFASCATFVFGSWFWLFGSGGTTQLRYFMPFLLMAAIFALPVILKAVQAMTGWKMAILSVLMIAPVMNIGMLLPQRNAPIQWQKCSGVNLTSGVPNAVMTQAMNFVTEVKREGGSNMFLYSMALNMADAYFSSAIEYTSVTMHPMPIKFILRPVDWRRPSTYRKKEMFASNYWLFQPVRNPRIAQAVLTASSIDTFEQETLLFQAWATQLTMNEGVTVVSDTPTARVLRITDKKLLESEFAALVAKHNWRDTFVHANSKR